jgi:hypothetical protein
MNGLVPADTKDRSPQYQFRFGINNNLHETLRLAFFDGAPDLRHRPHADADFSPGVSSLMFGNAHTAQGRVDIECVGADAVAETARFVVEEVRGDDLEIVIGGVGESAATVAVA